jgi:hypothetical protein
VPPSFNNPLAPSAVYAAWIRNFAIKIQHPSILPVRSVKKLGLILVVAAAADIFISVFPLSSAPREKDRARLVTEPDVRRLQRAQQLAWFKLWSTVEMRELMAYVR